MMMLFNLQKYINVII